MLQKYIPLCKIYTESLCNCSNITKLIVENITVK